MPFCIQRWNRDLYECLIEEGFSFLLDCGLRSASNAEPLSSLEGVSIVAGLETIESPQELKRTGATVGHIADGLQSGSKQGEPLVSLSSENLFASYE